MVENKNTNPHYYLTMEVCMDDLIAMRAQAPHSRRAAPCKGRLSAAMCTR